jgi:uncharacterized protein YbbK (DUF523 family)
MPNKNYLKSLRIPTKENPLRILVSACFVGIKCGFEGDTYGDYPSVSKLLDYENVKLIPFCPEDFSFGTPREMCDIHGGNGLDVLEGNAKVLTESGKDWTEGMIKASEKMLQIAIQNKVELAIMMDVSAACGNHVIYDGNRYSENKKYQIGMGVCGAQLHRAGFEIISWREFESLELLYSKIDPNHKFNVNARDFDQHDWFLEYFHGNRKKQN